jgi:hypothetical protein
LPKFRDTHHVGSFQTSSNKSCSGNLVNENWIVTAASWYVRKTAFLVKGLFSFSETRVTIHFGKAEDGSAQFISSSRIIPHPQYSAATKKDDIMLIKLESC